MFLTCFLNIIDIEGYLDNNFVVNIARKSTRFFGQFEGAVDVGYRPAKRRKASYSLFVMPRSSCEKDQLGQAIVLSSSTDENNKKEVPGIRVVAIAKSSLILSRNSNDKYFNIVLFRL